MEIINAGMFFIAGAVIYKGGVVLLNGLTMWGDGKSQNNANKQEEGLEKAFGGGFIVILGIAFVPIMQQYLQSLM